MTTPTDPQPLFILPIFDEDKTLKFFCQKCKSYTSGAFLGSHREYRQCARCSSKLHFCPSCQSYVSGTNKLDVYQCDGCKTDYVTKTTEVAVHLANIRSKEIVLSGVRATGRLHLGNFLGAVQQFVDFQNQGNLCLIFIADWHTLTTERDGEKIRGNVIELATDYLAAGLDPERSLIYTQSSVPEIAELALYLSMIQGMNVLNGMPTLKDIVKEGTTMTLGHLSYPVLMAADILGPRATIVPVGVDQKPHIELACDLARKFNHEYDCQIFTVPSQKASEAPKVPGLDGKKMGKSFQEQSIRLDDDQDTIFKRYKKHGITDEGRKSGKDPGNPFNCKSVYPVHQILLKDDPDTLRDITESCQNGSRGCVDCKRILAEKIATRLGPMRERRRELEGQSKRVQEILHYGGLKVRGIVRETLEQVKDKIGIVSY